MADNNLPAPTPAPNDGSQPQPNPAPAPSSEPAPKPADDKPQGSPTLTLESLSEDDRNYLKSQGVTELNTEALQKVINHARSSQKTAADIKNQLDSIKKTVNPEPTPSNPLTDPGSSGQPQPDGSKPTQQPAAGIDQATAFLLTNQLATNFPRLKEDLTSGKFYQDMQAMGLPVKNSDGTVNLTGMLTYGKMVHEQRELEAKLEEAGKPGEGAIPDANPTTPQQPAADAPMTKQMALAIAAHVSKGGTHARSEEAKQFLQTNIGK